MPERFATVAHHREPHGFSEMSPVIAERRRIARDIHDRIAQQLACLKLHLHLLGRDGDHGEIDVELASALKQVDEISNAIQEVVFGLRNTVETRQDLRSLAGDALESWGQQNRVAVDFRADGDFTGIDRTVALSILSCICEAATNITKHARGATRAVVTLSRRQDHLRFTVADDGSGFASDEMLRRTEAQSMAARQFGLWGMRERVEELGGELFIASASCEGTSLSAFIPLGTRQ